MKGRGKAGKGELDEQLREYINEWRSQRAKEEEELKRLKEKQAKRKEIRAEQEKKLAAQKVCRNLAIKLYILIQMISQSQLFMSCRKRKRKNSAKRKLKRRPKRLRKRGNVWRKPRPRGKP